MSLMFPRFQSSRVCAFQGPAGFSERRCNLFFAFLSEIAVFVLSPAHWPNRIRLTKQSLYRTKPCNLESSISTHAISKPGPWTTPVPLSPQTRNVKIQSSPFIQKGGRKSLFTYTITTNHDSKLKTFTRSRLWNSDPPGAQANGRAHVLRKRNATEV